MSKRDTLTLGVFFWLSTLTLGTLALGNTPVTLWENLPCVILVTGGCVPAVTIPAWWLSLGSLILLSGVLVVDKVIEMKTRERPIDIRTGTIMDLFR
jgi:hypothetical protein